MLVKVRRTESDHRDVDALDAFFAEGGGKRPGGAADRLGFGLQSDLLGRQRGGA